MPEVQKKEAPNPCWKLKKDMPKKMEGCDKEVVSLWK